MLFLGSDHRLGTPDASEILDLFQNVSRFGFSRYIVFVMYLFFEKGTFINFKVIHQDDTSFCNFPDLCQKDTQPIKVLQNRTN